MSVNTSSTISNRTNLYAEMEMLRHAGPNIVLGKLGMVKQMPKNKTTTIKFRRPNVFTEATTPITEGVTPPPTAFTFTDVSGSLAQYGMVVPHTDVIADTNEDPVVNEMSRQSGENIGRTTEALNWSTLKGGTTVFYANGSARAGVNTAISLNKVRAVVRSLKAQKAMPITTVVKPGAKYETFAVEPAYVAVAHTDMEADIRNLPGFVPCVQYGSYSKVCEEEIGKVENVRFVLSPDLDPIQAAGSATLNGMVADDSTNVDVYPVLFFGKEAFGTVALAGRGAVEPTLISANQKTKDDPLGQRGYVGWLTWHLCLILNENWMARLECGATDL